MAQNLKGILPDRAVQVIQSLETSLSSLSQRFTSFAGKPFVTTPEADAKYGSPAQRKALQVSGSNPLNVAGLIGVLSQPQLANAAALTAAPTNGPNAQPGTIVTINNVISQVISPGNAQALSAIANILLDTRANRIANYAPASYPPGTPFFESDSTLIYIIEVVSGSNAWVWISGTYKRTQAQLAALAGALGVNDTGLLVNVTDYAHILQWTGSAWTWGPGEAGSGYFQDFVTAPTGSGWHACDGTAQNYLKADGTTASITLPNTVATAAYRKLGAAYIPAITAADPPTVTTTVPPASAAAAATSTPVTVQSGTGTTVNSLTGGGGGGGGGGGVNIAATVTLPGDPIANFQAIQYFRQ